MRRGRDRSEILLARVFANGPKHVYATIDGAPYVNPTGQQRSVVVDTPGKLHVEHGRSCARANQAASETYIGMRITDSVLPPKGYTGTVYQNGYELRRGHEESGAATVEFMA